GARDPGGGRFGRRRRCRRGHGRVERALPHRHAGGILHRGGHGVRKRAAAGSAAFTPAAPARRLSLRPHPESPQSTAESTADAAVVGTVTRTAHATVVAGTVVLVGFAGVAADARIHDGLRRGGGRYGRGGRGRRVALPGHRRDAH